MSHKLRCSHKNDSSYLFYWVSGLKSDLEAEINQYCVNTACGTDKLSECPGSLFVKCVGIVR